VTSHLPFAPGQAIGHLFDGGRHFGRYRVAGASAARRLAWIAASPLVLAVLLGRIARRVTSRDRRLVPPLIRSFPWLLVLLGSWAAGEARGYVEGTA